MTGSLDGAGRPAQSGEARYAVLRIALDDGRTLVYRDVRRLGTLLWLDAEGWEAYDRGHRPGAARRLALRRQDACRHPPGIPRGGEESAHGPARRSQGWGTSTPMRRCSRRGIDPSKPASRSSRPGGGPLLHRDLVRILEAAIRSKGSHRSGLPDRHRRAGDFQLELLVYGREGEPCVAAAPRSPAPTPSTPASPCSVIDARRDRAGP